MKTLHHHIVMAITLLGFLCAAPLSTASEPQPYVQSQKVSAQHSDIYVLLPNDADFTNMERQRRAVEKGFYWTKDRIIKPLDRKS